MKKSLLILPVALIAMAMAVTACGGGSSSSGGEEGAIERAIETAATSSDPSKCTEVQTEAFNETETGESGEAALETCEKEAEEGNDPAESVSVSNVSESGDTATAEVDVEGGSLSGQGLEVEMAKEEGDWKLNKFLGFTNYEPSGLAAAVEKALPEEEGISPALAKCVAEGIEGMSQEEAEAMVFEKDSEGLGEIAGACNE